MLPKSFSASNNAVATTRPPWAALVLMATSVSLNYVDRGTLSMAATNIQSDLHLTNYQLGLLLSAFFWTYALCQTSYIAGWLADRLNVCWVLGVGVALWSAATGAFGIAHSFVVMFGLRLLLGAGECVAYPSYSRVIVNCFPEHRRGFSNGTIDAASKTGPAIGALLGGLLIASVGWRMFFVVLGAAGLVWLIPWMKWRPRSPRLKAGKRAESAASMMDLLRLPDLWWTALALFCSNYFWYFLITWLPPYLEKERGFPKHKMAIVSALAYSAIAISRHGIGMALGFVDRKRREFHPGAKNIRGGGAGDVDGAGGCLGGRQRKRRDGNPDIFLRGLWKLRVEYFFDFADTGGAGGVRAMDGRAERDRKHGGDRSAMVHGLGGGPERSLLCGVPGGGADGAGLGTDVCVRGGED